MKVIALYFPQFHRIDENDRWWGNGFTDWNNVRTAHPLYKEHYQPRIPLHANYYDQSELATLAWQIDLAKQYGVHGFCHYHYWFDGKQLLETPTNLLLDNPSLDMPFCLSWANETWSRRWDGRDHHILIQQTHPADRERWRLHFDYLIRAWKDPRAIKVDGKPVFCIYRPQSIAGIDDMIAAWQTWSREAGLPGIYLIHQKQYDFTGSAKYTRSFDALFQFQPFEAMYSSLLKRNLGTRVLARSKRLLAMAAGRRHQLHDYDTTWEKVVELRQDENLTTFPGAYIDWDNTARYKKRATIFSGATPARFQYWMTELSKSMPARALPEDFVFLNAWNEWSEGTYLEPDDAHKYDYLEALAAALRHTKPA